MIDRRETGNAGRHSGQHCEQIELDGFNRSLAEFEWLLLVLILGYSVIPGADFGTEQVTLACTAYAAFVVLFRYLNLFTIERRWKLALESWVMIALVAFSVWHTGKSDSPLIILYLLPTIFSALTLGKVTTFLQVGLITALYLHAAYAAEHEEFLSYATFSQVLLNFAPVVLVAYLTSLLAADMRLARAFAQGLAETDELTRLLNMRAFKAALTEEHARAKRQNGNFALMMIDMDSLKSINDRYGHEVGNEMLRNLAATCLKTFRSSDVVARYGGDEFIVLLPGTEPAAAREAAERLRQSIANMSFDADGERVSTTVSIGCVFYPDTSEDLGELLASADSLMYASKNDGRNRVTFPAS